MRYCFISLKMSSIFNYNKHLLLLQLYKILKWLGNIRIFCPNHRRTIHFRIGIILRPRMISAVSNTLKMLMPALQAIKGDYSEEKETKAEDKALRLKVRASKVIG